MSENMYILHTSSGERILGNVLDDTDDYIVVEWPLNIGQMPKQGGGTVLVPMPFVIGKTSNVEHVDFNKKCIICKYAADAEMCKAHTSMVEKIRAAESGIELAPANALTRIK